MAAEHARVLGDQRHDRVRDCKKKQGTFSSTRKANENRGASGRSGAARSSSVARLRLCGHAT